MLLPDLVLALHDPLLEGIADVRVLAQLHDLILTVGHEQSFLYGGSLLYAVAPLLEQRELVHAYPCPALPSHPSEGRHVSHRVLVVHEVLVPGRAQVILDDAIQPSRLVLIPIYAVLNLLWRVAEKVVCLTLLREPYQSKFAA